MTSKIVYVAAPYSDEDDEQVLDNVQKAMEVGIELMEIGYTPFVPHLFHYLDCYAGSMGHEFEKERYMEMDRAFLRMCDCVLVVDISEGVQRELEWADEHGITIYHSKRKLPLVRSFSKKLPSDRSME